MAYAFALTFSGTLFHEPIPINFHRHSQSFASRQISPSRDIPLPDFIALGLDYRHLVNNLGWGSLLDDAPTLVCPAAVRLFYSNLRHFGLHSRTLTSLMAGHLMMLPAADIGNLLHFPVIGENLAAVSEFGLFNFNLAEEAERLSGFLPGPDGTIPSLVLLPTLQVFHYFLSRVFLPRSTQLDRITPLDVWIMNHAIAAVPLDYSQLFFGALIPFVDHSFLAPLPFAARITELLLALPISLSWFRTESPTLWLTADDVLDELEIAIGGGGASCQRDLDIRRL
ncbi:unnamed protein product [Linum trigynum]|uniref:Uncharacterized protein n=1 Tax=Linum trigynum TaxID=586398 RepID=A0AAV2DYL3_9ROSI